MRQIDIPSKHEQQLNTFNTLKTEPIEMLAFKSILDPTASVILRRHLLYKEVNLDSYGNLNSETVQPLNNNLK